MIPFMTINNDNLYPTILNNDNYPKPIERPKPMHPTTWKYSLRRNPLISPNLNLCLKVLIIEIFHLDFKYYIE
ncbi:hypothetical protein STEG23_016937 [Scotinomys teguina]